MVRARKKAEDAARKAIESMYSGFCDIIERRDVKDEKSKITKKNIDVIVAEDVPCKLSFEKIESVLQTETFAETAQGVKLFIAPEIEVKAGSKIIVEQNGVKNEYYASGDRAVYPTHAEIVLELYERRA